MAILLAPPRDGLTNIESYVRGLTVATRRALANRDHRVMRILDDFDRSQRERILAVCDALLAKGKLR